MPAAAPAVLSLSKGAKMAGCWLNTGEGGLSPHHLAGGADIVFHSLRSFDRSRILDLGRRMALIGSSHEHGFD
jgi:glutamate synthase domain-containing protein 2